MIEIYSKSLIGATYSLFLMEIDLLIILQQN